MRTRYYILIFSFSILSLSSCVNFEKQLTDPKYKGESVLYKQKIKGNKYTSKYELDELVKQTPNRKFIFPFLMPYVKAYLIGEKHFDEEKIMHKYSWKLEKIDQKIAKNEGDSSKVQRLEKRKAKVRLKQQTVLKEGNWLMRAVGEPPALYDTTLAKRDLDQLNLYIQSKGFFNGSVTKDSSYLKRKIKITYNINEGRPHLINKVAYHSGDETITNLLTLKKKNRHIHEGNNFEVSKISLERERIYRLMKNNGYFDFQRQYIYFEVDSSISPYKVDIDVYIDDSKSITYEQYLVKEVYVHLDIKKSNTLDTLDYKGIKYIYGEDQFSKKILNGSIKIRPNSLYSISETQTTQQQLGNIDIFKFVNINYQKTDSNQLVAYIHLSSFKKYQITTEGGANLNVNQGQGLPGPFVNVSFKNRKVFNGFEIFDLSGRYSLESQVNLTNQDQVFRSTEWGINASFTFPKLLIPGKFKYNMNNFYPKTRLQIGYTDIARVEYQRTNLKFVGSYELQNRKNQRLIISPIDLSLVNTTNKTVAFQSYLDNLRANGNNLFASFNPSIIETFSVSYIFNNNDLTKNRKAYFMKVLGESGGQTFNFFQNTLGGADKNTVLDLPYFQFYKLETDLRYYLPVSKTTNLALRVNTGVAKPYGFSDVLPYEKFFFTGGLNSNRAWNPRRLGPGRFVARDDNGEVTYRFEQQGEIIFESNIEYRGKIAGFLHGAAFVDIGNVWTIDEDEARPGAQFEAKNFFKEVAVGAGIGLRFDFSFLIFRFDIGEKIWDPARQSVVPFKDKFARVYNIGIGYPF